jgi:hypothetical protein
LTAFLDGANTPVNFSPFAANDHRPVTHLCTSQTPKVRQQMEAVASSGNISEKLSQTSV